MSFMVVFLMLNGICAKTLDMFLQVCLIKKDAGAMWALDMLVVVSYVIHMFSAFSGCL
jgi:hypothetical protein